MANPRGGPGPGESSGAWVLGLLLIIIVLGNILYRLGLT